MQIYVLPISGGYFPHQLAMIEWMNSTGIKPDLVLGSSGGNVAAYLALSANWNNTIMKKNIIYLNSKILIKSWWPDYLQYLPSIVKGYPSGSLYNINPKFYKLFSTLFQYADITATELWSGTFNKTRGTTHCFCNKSAQTSIVKDSSPYNRELLNYQAFTYVDGDVSKLGKVCFASAAVPAIFPPIPIDNELHIDGGDSFTSPLTPMKNALQKTVANDSFHLTYMSPYNIQNPSTEMCDISDIQCISANYEGAKNTGGTMYNQGQSAMAVLLKSLALQDRMYGINLITNNGNEQSILLEERIISYSEFVQLQSTRQTYYRSMLELYPLSKSYVTITKFTGKDILSIMDQTTKQMGMRIWYIPYPVDETITTPLED